MPAPGGVVARGASGTPTSRTRSSPRPSTRARRALGLSGEKEGPYDWVPPSYWYDTSHSDRRRLVADQRGRVVGLRQRGERGRHHAHARLDRALPIAGRADPAVDSPRLQPVPRSTRRRTARPYNGGYSFGTLHNFDTAMPNATAPGRACAVRRGGAGAGLRDAAVASSRPTSTTRRTREPVDRDRLLAAEQGLAEAALGPLQLRLRPGRQLLRRAGGKQGVHALFAYDYGPGDGRQPHRAAPVGPVGRAEGLRPRRHAARRPESPDCDVGSTRECTRTCSLPSCPRPPSRRTAAKTYFVELLLRQAVRRRPQRLLALHPARPRELGRRSGNPQATMSHTRTSRPAEPADRHRSTPPRSHPADGRPRLDRR